MTEITEKPCRPSEERRAYPHTSWSISRFHPNKWIAPLLVFPIDLIYCAQGSRGAFWRQYNPGPCVCFQRGYTLWGSMNIWCPIFTRQSKPLEESPPCRAWRPLTLRLKKSFSTFLLLSCSCEREAALYGTENRRFMSLCAMLPRYIRPNWITLGVTLLLFQWYYTVIRRAVDFSFCEKVISELNRITAWSLNDSVRAAKTL